MIDKGGSKVQTVLSVRRNRPLEPQDDGCTLRHSRTLLTGLQVEGRASQWPVSDLPANVAACVIATLYYAHGMFLHQLDARKSQKRLG